VGEPVTAKGATGGHSNLVLRIVAALVLVPVALAAAYAGGWYWLALVTVTACGLFVEWQFLIGAAKRSLLGSGAFVLIMSAAALNLHDLGAAVICVAAAVLLCAAFSTEATRLWAPLGAVYAAAALLASVLLRQDRDLGFEALLFVFLMVWGTDILGYFAGRGIGGPKLWVRVSPNKTWAGAIAGLIGSVVLAVSFAWFDHRAVLPLTVLAVGLSIVSQLGDLFESAVKRHFGVKDSSHLIPGHGGLLDRLDGFVTAVAAAALIGVIRGGTDAAGHGLLVW
jgi:phosphatidate cytidylyltransferase